MRKLIYIICLAIILAGCTSSGFEGEPMNTTFRYLIVERAQQDIVYISREGTNFRSIDNYDVFEVNYSENSETYKIEVKQGIINKFSFDEVILTLVPTEFGYGHSISYLGSDHIQINGKIVDDSVYYLIQFRNKQKVSN